jgi:hypothetical protein
MMWRRGRGIGVESVGMRIDLSDLERLEGIAEGLGRLFWCLIVVAFLAAILGSAGTGLLVLILAAAAFVGRVGLEDFVRSRREPVSSPTRDPQITIHRTSRTSRARRAAPNATPRSRRPVAR